MSRKPLLVLAAGGTGGHMFPAQALAEHMLAQGCPILGDPIYAKGEALAFPRLMLHAETLSLHHPTSGEMVSFTAPCAF